MMIAILNNQLKQEVAEGINRPLALKRHGQHRKPKHRGEHLQQGYLTNLLTKTMREYIDSQQGNLSLASKP
jgi:hypothetical protein